MSEIKKYQIKLDFIEGEGIRRSDGIIASEYNRDLYITVPLYKDITLDDFVNVEIDPLRYTVERQSINPFFIELGFFEDIESVNSQRKNDLNSVEDRAPSFNIDINK